MTVSTQSSAPMELLGAHTGVNVIDPSTILTRLWYFDGRFLRASGFRMDQEYVRSLVALSNQAVGHGVVSGFTPTLTGGDVISVTGGLGLAASGRPLYLPSPVELSIATLIQRSAGTFDPGDTAAPGTADFTPCPPGAATVDVETPSTGTFYLLTVSGAEALCGEEEKFGQLCEDACAAESDRSVAVEGVCFRVHPLQLSLPLSEVIPFGGTHLRSRVASAYYAAEARAVASMISGPGLRSAVWCAGAPGVGQEEIPLAVFDRVGSVTTWLDMWTARREVNESSPHRYWSRRFAMRPLDVFWAQVLQFQCQLLTLGASGPGGGGSDDPCAEERQTLEAASAVLNTFLQASILPEDREGLGPASTPTPGSSTAGFGLAGSGGGGPSEAPSPIEPMASIAGVRLSIPQRAQDRLLELSGLIGRTLSGRTPTGTGSVLLDGGIIELPSGGYLPVDPDRDIQAQVRAFMGPGIDLRFCAVRPDFIPEALQEAQHMDRISLTVGIDDPADIEEVDVLVPGGRIEQVQETIDAFEGIARFAPSAKDPDKASLRFRVIGREQPGDTWSWTLAGHSETQPGLGFADVRTAAAAFARGEEIADSAVRERIVELREAAAEFDRRFSRDVNRRALLRNRLAARRGRIGPVDTGRNPESVSVWLDFAIDQDLRDTAVGDRINARAAGTIHVIAGDKEDLRDFRYQGDLVVAAHQRRSDGSVRVRTAFTGFVDRFLYESGTVVEDDSVAVTDHSVDWTFSLIGGAVEQVTMSMEIDADRDRPSTLTLQLQEVGSPRRIAGTLVNVRSLGDNEPVVRTLADANIEEKPEALDPGSFGRDMADSVIDVIGSAMVRTGRDANWGLVAERRLLGGGSGSGSTVVRSDADWVMFHRRRTKLCGTEVVDRPVTTRIYRWYHADIPGMTDTVRKRIQTVLASADPERRAALIAELGLGLVSSLSFPENGVELVSSPVALRADWSANVASDSLVAAVVADPPTGDGAVLALGRLSSGLNTISGLIDTDDLQPPSVVNEIPAEYQTRGTDGVIFSVGSSSPAVDTVIARLVRIPIRALDLVESFQGPMTEKALIEQLANFNLRSEDFFHADYVDEEIENKQEVVKWWGPDSPALAIRLGTTAATSADERERWLGPRGRALADLLDGADPIEPLEGTTWELNKADVIMLLFAEPRELMEFDDAVLDVVLSEPPDFRRREFQILETALVETHPTAELIRALAADFDIAVDSIDFTQPIVAAARELIKIASESRRYKDFVTEIRRRYQR